MDRFAEAVKACPPGTVLRFDKLLQFVNRDREPTVEDVDPPRMLINEGKFLPFTILSAYNTRLHEPYLAVDLMSILKYKYESIKETSSDGLSLMREKLPKYFDKHSLDRGRRVSQRERDTMGKHCYLCTDTGEALLIYLPR
jgi:hypothetical protein